MTMNLDGVERGVAVSTKDAIERELKAKKKEERKATRKANKQATKYPTGVETDDPILFDFSNAINTESGELEKFRNLDRDNISADDNDDEDEEFHSKPKSFNRSASQKWIQNLMEQNNIGDLSEEDYDDIEDDEDENPSLQQHDDNNNHHTSPVVDTETTPTHQQSVTSKKKKKEKQQRRDKETTALDAEEMAIATAMVSSKKRKRDLIDDSANRYLNFDDDDDEDLPDWFVEDQKMNNRPCLRTGISEREIDTQRINLGRAGRVNSRSLSKLAEVKARKKRKLATKLY